MAEATSVKAILRASLVVCHLPASASANALLTADRLADNITWLSTGDACPGDLKATIWGRPNRSLERHDRQGHTHEHA